MLTKAEGLGYWDRDRYLGWCFFTSPIDKTLTTRKQAIDFADEYPDTEVTGTDLSPIQPSLV